MAANVHRLFESLENRRLLSSVTLHTNGVLRIIGDDDVTDQIALRLSGDQISVVVNGGAAQLFDKSAVRLIRVHGRGSEDAITIDESNGALGERIEINGGEGNDVLTGGTGSETIIGAGGDDRITGNGGNDLLNGGEGNDVITGGEQRDLIYAGPGDDDVTAGGGRDFVRGGAGNDTLRGNAGADYLFGETGNDEVHGDEDADVIVGGQGNDALHAGEGNNFIFAFDAADTVTAGSGNDRAYIGAGGGAQIDLGDGRNVEREVNVRELIRRFHRDFIREIGFLLRHVYELR